ncbi:MAG TPA: YajG family lipoprotein [Plasticicumulans sp.]|uniref:YajG family lipoprotein n=1 Tax=Plasticicumulans sp. TaxID=2307179 RepID=UPI002C19C2B8|nr:YajG family lipoprotein [Plasticicumulans sp.]HNG49971.1 YajG family lipoprotein [Plasticicumulans sp.]HNO60389.1 YajG family lipoprotein [Plasticicumulans sp.]
MRLSAVLRRSLLCAVLAVAGGCALSPQTLNIHPSLDVAAPPLGRGRPLMLEVIDARTQPAVFGTRGGVYQTATVGPRNDVAAAVRQALAERLTAAGFVLSAPQPGSRTLRVELLRIDYHASGEPTVGEVRTSCEVRAIAGNAASSYSGNYRANSVRQVVGSPGVEDNEQIVNEIISQALQRMLADRGLLETLAR